MTENTVTDTDQPVEEAKPEEPPYHWYVNVYLGGKRDDRGSYDISYEPSDRYSVKNAIAQALGLSRDENIVIQDYWEIGDSSWYRKITGHVIYRIRGSKVVMEADITSNYNNWR